MSGELSLFVPSCTKYKMFSYVRVFVDVTNLKSVRMECDWWILVCFHFLTFYFYIVMMRRFGGNKVSEEKHNWVMVVFVGKGA